MRFRESCGAKPLSLGQHTVGPRVRREPRANHNAAEHLASARVLEVKVRCTSSTSGNTGREANLEVPRSGITLPEDGIISIMTYISDVDEGRALLWASMRRGG